MALTDNQLDLGRLMITRPTMGTHIDLDLLKSWRAMSDDDYLAVITTWAAEKKANQSTSQGLVAQIVALGG